MSPPRTEAMLRMYRSAGIGGVVQEASPHRLIHMLLDGAISRLAVAGGAITAGDLPQKGRLIGDAMNIIGTLRGSLDFGAGGEIASALDSLYEYILRRLLEASAQNDAKIIAEVTGLLGEIKSAWDAIPGARTGSAARTAVGV